jgi:hypothetical protein
MDHAERIDRVRERLAAHFPKAELRVRDWGRLQPVAFMLRWSPWREARVRIARECFERYERADEILPAAALHALDAGESVLVSRHGMELESTPAGGARGHE